MAITKKRTSGKDNPISPASNSGKKKTDLKEAEMEAIYAKHGLATKRYDRSNTGNKVYDNLKNSATKSYNKSVDLQRDATDQFFGDGKYNHYNDTIQSVKDYAGAMGKQYASWYNSAKSKVTDTFADAYGAVMGVNKKKSAKGK